MRMTSVSKCQLTSLNYKRYHLSDKIVSFPLSHPYLDEIRSYKIDLKERLQKLLRCKQFEMVRIEANAATVCKKKKKMHILTSILLQLFTYFKLESNKILLSNKFHNTDHI